MQQIRIDRPKKPTKQPVLDLPTPSGRMLPY
jgi:hypothetical protein